MTYRELLEELKKLSEDQLDLSVTIYDISIDEYYSADIEIANQADSEDRLGAPFDVPHPVISQSTEEKS